jgi:hypothetical protein
MELEKVNIIDDHNKFWNQQVNKEVFFQTWTDWENTPENVII